MAHLLTTTTPTADRLRVVVGVCRDTWPARWRCGDRAGLLHAVEVHREAAELDGEPELALCGAFVAATTLSWVATAGPSPAPRCPECAAGLAAGGTGDPCRVGS